MKEKIRTLLKDLEKKYAVTILFAVESGSREWGFASDDSDYDVRAVHFGSVKKYLGLHQPKENIEVMVEDGAKIDIVSWDIKKFASLLLKSNPTVSEWLQSKIVYVESPYRAQFHEIFETGFSPFTLKKHYVSLARENYEKYVRNQTEVNFKKYIYIMRALACAEFLLANGKVPPLNYKDVIGYLPDGLATSMEDIVKKKQKSESTMGPADKKINEFVESYFTKQFEAQDNRFSKEEVNDLVVKIIETAK